MDGDLAAGRRAGPVEAASPRSDPRGTQRAPGLMIGERPIRVVFNPRAGRRLPFVGRDVSPREVEAALAASGIRADIVESRSIGHARATAAEAVRDGEPVLIAAGGDGTVGAVASELAHSQTVLGILPTGSVMNIARMLGIPRDVRAAAQVIKTGACRSLDVGVAGDRPFFEAVSVGIVGAVFRELDRFQEGDRWALLRAVEAGVRYRRSGMRMTLDGRIVETRALLVTVANGPYAGAAMTVAPDARPGDGRLDVRIFEGHTKASLLAHFLAIAGGRRAPERGVRRFRASVVEVEASRPLPVRADAEDLGTTPVRLEVLPAVVQVLAPARVDGASPDASG